MAEGLAAGALHDAAILDYQPAAQRQVEELRAVVRQALAARRLHRQLVTLLAPIVPLSGPGLAGAGGEPVWGLETRSVEAEGATLVYGINLSTDPLAVRLRGAHRSTDWLEGGPLAGETLTLEPRRPILLRIE